MGSHFQINIWNLLNVSTLSSQMPCLISLLCVSCHLSSTTGIQRLAIQNLLTFNYYLCSLICLKIKQGKGVSRNGLAVLNKILNTLDKINCLRLIDDIKIKKPDISK